MADRCSPAPTRPGHSRPHTGGAYSMANWVFPTSPQPMHRTRLDHRPCLVGLLGSAGIGRHLALLRRVGSAGAVAAAGTVGLPALATALTVAGVAVGPVGAADDRPGPGGGLAGPPFA